VLSFDFKYVMLNTYSFYLFKYFYKLIPKYKEHVKKLCSQLTTQLSTWLRHFQGRGPRPTVPELHPRRPEEGEAVNEDLASLFQISDAMTSDHVHAWT
jgi:hypothetical protein